MGTLYVFPSPTVSFVYEELDFYTNIIWNYYRLALQPSCFGSRDTPDRSHDCYVEGSADSLGDYSFGALVP
jgi:hypothetical protein